MLYVFDVPNTFINCRSFNCYYTVSPTLARVLGALPNTRMQRALLHLNYLQREYCTLFVIIVYFVLSLLVRLPVYAKAMVY